jgi:hypothetical protein
MAKKRHDQDTSGIHAFYLKKNMSMHACNKGKRLLSLFDAWKVVRTDSSPK